MPTPQILADIVRLLIQLLPAMALVSLVLAGIALRLEGGSTFLIGGSFTKWILWSVIMLTLPQLLLWFSFFGLPVLSTAGGIGTNWLCCPWTACCSICFCRAWRSRCAVRSAIS